MRFVRKALGAMLAMSLVIGSACVLSGCDSGGSQSTQYKPIESNILKKLGTAGQEQSDAAKAEHPAKKKR
jgi:hypothetical protein